jgi:arsenate reductase
MSLYTPISSFLETLDVSTIATERKEGLNKLASFLQQELKKKNKADITFICTHNSRRSHLSQIWAQTIAQYFNFKTITSYSAGTEATAIFPMVINTLLNTGFKIEELSSNANPLYSIKASDNTHPIIGFSKTLDHTFNPKSGFAAIMTCSQADGGCPFIAGAALRLPLTYEDPKAFDDTPQQESL